MEITLAEPFDISSCERGGGAKLFVTVRWFEILEKIYLYRKYSDLKILKIATKH